MNDMLPICACLLGALIGFLTGVFGVGGGFLLTPLLMILLKIPAPVAVGTSLAAILPNAAFGMLARKKSATVDYKLASFISAGTITGILIGSHWMNTLKAIPKVVVFGTEQNPVQYFLLLLFLVTLTFIVVHQIIDYRNNKGVSPEKRVGLLEQVRFPPYAAFSSLEEPLLPILPLFVVGLAVGLLTGLLGIGGGVILLPILVHLVGQRAAKAAGTSLAIVFASSLVAVLIKGTAGDIDFKLLSVLLMGGAIGTFIGTRIGLNLAGPRIRVYFSCVVTIVILIVISKLWRLTFS